MSGSPLTGAGTAPALLVLSIALSIQPVIVLRLRAVVGVLRIMALLPPAQDRANYLPYAKKRRHKRLILATRSHVTTRKAEKQVEKYERKFLGGATGKAQELQFANKQCPA